MNPKSIEEVKQKIHSLQFAENFDLIVAIANGGIIPAALINQILLTKMELLRLSFRDARQQPLFDSPRLIEKINFDVAGKTILLVEDRVKTGATLDYARALLSGAALIKTFAVNGKADYSLYNEACFPFPWIMGNNKK
jgi:uncharacterized protein